MSYAGKKSSEIQDSSANLDINIHAVGLVSVLNVQTEPNKDDKVFDVLDWKFSNKLGESYTLRMFEPNGDDEEKNAKQEDRYATIALYILSKVLNKEVEIPATVKNWKGFTAFCASAIPASELYDVKASKDYKNGLWLKLTGSVYKDRPSIGITVGYLGWLERVDSGKKPKYSPNESQGNAAYLEFISKPKKSSGAAATEADDNTPF